jgi:hypothetical protein
MSDESDDDPGLEDSPLLQKFDRALRAAGAPGIGIRVSITRKGQWFQPKDETDKYWVKWLCWAVVDKDGDDLTEPEFEVLDGDLDEKRFRANVARVFSSYECTFDNEINVA